MSVRASFCGGRSSATGSDWQALCWAWRKVAAWPVGIVGNVLLFTVFVGNAMGGAFDTPQQLDLWGQAGRQVFFIIVSVYGWVRWYQFRKSHAEEGVGVRPRWAGASGRLQLLGALALTTIFYFVLKALGSWGPLADAWILTGSILATYGMARGWVEFWLVWIAVDLVGVPLLLAAGYYPSAIMYIVYGGSASLASWPGYGSSVESGLKRLLTAWLSQSSRRSADRWELSLSGSALTGSALRTPPRTLGCPRDRAEVLRQPFC